MNIKILEPTDNIKEYMLCIDELNNSTELLSTTEQIKSILIDRPTNILTFVGLLDKTIVATSTIIIEKKLRYNRLCCHIEDVGVHPEYRGFGYGKEMVRYCIDIAKKNNCYKVKLNCDRKLLGFYEKIGFKDNGLHLIQTNE